MGKLLIIFIYILFPPLLVGQIEKTNSEKSLPFEELNDNYQKSLHKNNHDQAIYYAKLAIEYCREADLASDSLLIITLTNLASTYITISQLGEAIPLLVEAKELSQETFDQNSLNYISSLNNLAYVYFRTGKLKIADSLYNESIRIYKYSKENSDSLYAVIITNKADLLNYSGQYTEAESIYKEAVELRKRIFGVNHPEYGITINNLAHLYYRIGKYSEAEPLFLNADKIFEDTYGREHPYSLTSQINLGSFYMDFARYEIAEQILTNTLKICEKTIGKYSPEYGVASGNLGKLYKELGNYKEAEYFLIEAIHSNEIVYGKAHIHYAFSLNHLATLYAQLGVNNKAKELFIEANKILESLIGKKHLAYITNLFNIISLSNIDTNFEYYNNIYLEARALLDSLVGKQHIRYADYLLNHGNFYSRFNKFKNAELLLSEAVQKYKAVVGPDHPLYARSLNSLAFLKFRLGIFEEAEELYSLAAKIRRLSLSNAHLDYAESIQGLAVYYLSSNQIKKGIDLINEASTIYRFNTDIALSFLSKNEATKYIEKYNNFTNTLNSQNIEHKELTAISFDNNLFYKGVLLQSVSRLKNEISQTSDSTLTKRYNDWISVNKQLAKQYSLSSSKRNVIENLENSANALEKELTRSIAGFAEARRQITWQEIQNKLSPNEAAIEFIHFRYHEKDWTDSTLYAALILRPGYDRPKFITLCEERDITNALSSNYTTVQERTEKIYGTIRGSVPVSKRNHSLLKELIWAPLDSLLDGVTKIYYAASGQIHKIALAAIPLDKSTYLADKYELVQMTSTRNLVVNTKKENTLLSDVTLFGGIQYEADISELQLAHMDMIKKGNVFELNKYTKNTRGKLEVSWQYLPGSKIEVDRIARIFDNKKLRSTKIEGYNALEEQFKVLGEYDRSPSVVHVATHGYFYPDIKDEKPDLSLGNPVFKFSEYPLIRSGLIMAGANHVWKGEPPLKGFEDGILTAYEISQMNLSNTKLAVLSACETGLGDIQGSEGVYGLQRAFKIAGVDYIIMSLWKVSDGKSTIQFMEKFYTHWLNGMDIHDAFNKAQRTIKKRYKDPYYWAGFVLVE